jgi:mRNA interferase HigB
MRLLTRRTAVDCWLRYPDAEPTLRAWCKEVEAAHWRTPADIKDKYRSASIVGNSRAVFNIAGGKYRIVVSVNYRFERVYIKWFGRHEEYDEIDVEVI